MKLRLLWVDDQATFASDGELSDWPPILWQLLRQDAAPDKEKGYFGPVTTQDQILPASFIDVWFANSFPRAVDLIKSNQIDVAILDMRLPVSGTDHEAIKKYLKRKDRQLPSSVDLETEMALAFWLWRELKEHSPKGLVLFYTNYGNTSEAFAYQPFMNPDPFTQMSPAIHEKNGTSLGLTFERFLENRARAALKHNDPGLIANLARKLSQDKVSSCDLLSLITTENLFLSNDHLTRANLADLFPAFAFAVANDLASSDEKKSMVVEMLEQAVGRFERCAVLARLTAPRNLDWTDRPTYGIQLVKDLPWAREIRAWPTSVGYSPLEMLSHGRTAEMTDEDCKGWNATKTLAKNQVETLSRYFKDEEYDTDHEDIKLLREWVDFCCALRTPFTDGNIPKEIDKFKSDFRWIPAEVLADIAKVAVGEWKTVKKCEQAIYGHRSSICEGVKSFVADLGNSEVKGGIFGSDGSTRPGECWMFVAGVPQGNRSWPHKKNEGNKIRTALSLLRGYLVSYQFRRADKVFEWRPFGSRGEHLDQKERQMVENCILENFSPSTTVIGYAFVLPDYPPDDER